jgi:putative tryptophan/tyrosine transport system substrate-binding protein
VIDRRMLLSAIASGLVASPLAAQAQQPGRVYRVGVLAARSLLADRLDAFEQRLATLGYIRRQNLLLEYRGVPDTGEDYTLTHAVELVALRVDVIVAPTNVVALHAKRATTTIPIVVLNVSDPVAIGLVASLARPGGNVTGLTLLSTGLFAKHLQLLHEALPSVSRVGVLWNPSSPTGPARVEEIEAAARVLRLKLHIVPAQGAESLAKAFAELAGARAQAVLCVPDGQHWAHRVQIAELALQYRLPTMFGAREHVTAGGLMAYGASTFDGYPRAADFVDKILRGAKPADLPIEQPTRFELLINLKTAKALGISIPQSLLLRADEVIQ